MIRKLKNCDSSCEDPRKVFPFLIALHSYVHQLPPNTSCFPPISQTENTQCGDNRHNLFIKQFRSRFCRHKVQIVAFPDDSFKSQTSCTKSNNKGKRNPKDSRERKRNFFNIKRAAQQTKAEFEF